MTKRKSLADALNAAANPTATITEERLETPAPNSATIAPKSTRTTAPAREGKKAVVGYFDPSVSRQLREIALAEGKTLQGLLREAINDFFVKRGKSTIA